MAKKHGLAHWLGHALVWLIVGFFRLIYFLLKLIVRGILFLLRKAFSASKKAAENTSKPSGKPSYSALSMQKQIAGNLSDFEDKLLSSKSSIGLILGSRGSGKSALGMRLLENISAKANRPVCAMGFEESTLPNWIRFVQTVEEVPNGAVVLIDEGGITFSSRSSMSPANKILSSLLLVARHKDLSVLFISQNSANLEVNTIRQADFLLMRKPSLLQKEFERKKIGEIYDEVAGEFASLADKGRYSTYIYSDEFRGFALNELPSFWSQKTSKAFAGFKPGEKK